MRFYRASRARGEAVLVMLVVAVLGGCAGASEPTTTTVGPSPTRPAPGPTTTLAPVQGVVFSPEFIQGAIPGERLVLLVGDSGPEAGPATIIAEATHATVTIEPSTLNGGEVAEVTVVPAAVDNETVMAIRIDATRGGETSSSSWTVNVMPWQDDRGAQARDILGLFAVWLADNRPNLGVTSETEFEGTFVAPELLVVSHYAFFNKEWELGLSWHVMLPPDDFSELYLRPRSELRPTMAFRIDSWQTALQSGSADISEVPPPLEVVR
ncbi:MAG: hypothetical protein WCE80_09985 [Acidimicrobiia bacterium]